MFLSVHFKLIIQYLKTKIFVTKLIQYIKYLCPSLCNQASKKNTLFIFLSSKENKARFINSLFIKRQLIKFK